ncbi:MAG: hypothetical protein AAF901_01470, partial [Bacteroidota bacterium]
MPTHTTGNATTFADYLADLSVHNKNTICAAVIQEALQYDTPELFFKDLLKYGCQSGIATSLIYYRDTHNFYDTHYQEIEALRDAYEEETGEPIFIQGDLKNFLAW